VRPSEDEALQADIYLEWLLGAVPASSHAQPIGPLALDLSDLDAAGAPPLDASLQAAAEVLRRSVVRFQPSFRFQEALAFRLRAGTAGAGESAIVSLPVSERLLPVVTLPDAPAWRNRGFLVGGAIASGVSVAGAIAAWRIGRGRRSAARHPAVRAGEAAARLIRHELS
jgi:hypothetical protein